MIEIPKVARNAAPFERRFLGFPTARAAFRAYLARNCVPTSAPVLLPAYIGWSPREGSGVFDPVRELELPYAFCRVSDRLEIDLEDLERKLERHRPGVLLVIHYFGYPDPAYERIVELGQKHGVLVLEDEAHSMLTDLVGGLTGRLGDAALFSLHKMLPLETGGGLLINPGGQASCAGIAAEDASASFSSFDLTLLASRRRENATRLRELLEPLRGRVDPLWSLPTGVVPQTFPVLIRTVSRDKLYEQMTEAGFGVVSLYHTMVDAIAKDEFPESHALAKCVMNLPVHQEAEPAALERMVSTLDRFTRPA